MKKYEEIINHLVGCISIGQYTIHQKIPSENELMDEFDVSSITVKRAMKELTEMGYIYRVKGSGSFVSEEAPLIKETLNQKVVTLILSNDQVNNSNLVYILKGIQDMLLEKGDCLVVEYADGSYEQEKETIQKIIGKQVDGLLVYINHVQLVHELLYAQKPDIPCVLIDRWDPDYPCNIVAPNNHDAAYQITEYLISNGHRNIAYIGFVNKYVSEAQRRQGYYNALNHRGLLEYYNPNLLLDDITSECVLNLYRAGVTAVFCVNDLVALKFINTMEKTGLRIPDDISVVGFDDYAPVQFLNVPLTTMRQDFEDLGRESARLILEKMDDTAKDKSGYKKVFCPTTLIERQSVKRLQDTMGRDSGSCDRKILVHPAGMAGGR